MRVPLAMIIVAFLVAGTLLSNPGIGAFLAVPGAVFVSVVLEELTEKVPSLGNGEEGDRRGPS